MKFKKLILLSLSFLSCLTSLFGFEMSFGSISTLTFNNTKKDAYAISELADTNNSSFVDYSFSFSNENNNMLNSRDFFRNKYGIETESVMLLNSVYCYSSFNDPNFNFLKNSENVETDSLVSVSNLTFFFDFKCILTKTVQPKKRIGISEKLARKLLNKNDNSELNENEIEQLSEMKLTANLDGINLNCTVYCLYKNNNCNSYFNRYFGDNFIVFHDTEISPQNYSYVLSAVTHWKKNYDYLRKFNNESFEYDIILRNEKSEKIILDDKIEDYKKRFNVNKIALLAVLSFVLSSCLFCCFMLVKTKNRYLLVLVSIIFVDIIKFIIIKNIASTMVSIIFSNYLCYFGILLYTLLFLKKKYKNE